jgi:hypothetical protein
MVFLAQHVVKSPQLIQISANATIGTRTPASHLPDVLEQVANQGLSCAHLALLFESTQPNFIVWMVDVSCLTNLTFIQIFCQG